MEIGKQQVGTDLSVSESQENGILSIEADLKTPILVGKISLGVQETAIFDAIEKKYNNALVVAGLEILKAAIAKIA